MYYKTNKDYVKINTSLTNRVSTLIVLLVISLSSFSQCPVPNPLVTGNCSYGSSSLSLSASGSSGYYNWYTSATGGSPIASGSTFQTPLLNATTTYHVSATEVNTALLFDGTNDYIALNMSYNTIGQIDELTLEAWVNTTESGTGTFNNWSIIDFDRSEYYNFFVRGDNGRVGFSTTGIGGTIHDFYSSTSVNDGNWHHIAAVYDGVDKIIYIDGVEVARSENAHGGSNLGSGINRFGFIGDGSEASNFNLARNNLYYNGLIDEVRIWNTVRTPTQINDFRDTCLVGDELGLDAYYNMNEASGGIITDVTGGGSDGTLFNFLSPWVIGASISCDCESDRIPVIATIGNNLSDTKLSCSNSMATLDAGSGFGSYLWSTGENTQTINTSQAGIYSVTTTGSCSGSSAVSVVGNTHSENALAFDGVNDYVAIENMLYRGSYSELTVDVWLRVDNSGNQVIASFDRNEYWRLEINGSGAGAGQVGFDLMTSSGQLDFGSVSRVDDGNWHHVAAVFDKGTVNIYIDGMLDATTSTGVTFGTGTTRYGFLGTGSEASSYNGSRGPNNYFIGDLDEVKIWNVARTQTEIRQNMTNHIAGNEANLELYYKFDETSGNAINDYSNRIIQNANMINFGTGARIISGTPMGDECVAFYPASWVGQSSSISSCDGESLTLSNMSGNPSGVHMFYINSVPNSTAGIVGLGMNDRYFGVYKVNDGTASYTATYDYTGSPGVNPESEPTVELFKRNDNAEATWVNTNAIHNTETNTLTAAAQGTEFILGSSGAPLPITLLSFEANTNNDRVDLKWITASEINNDFFTIEKSFNATIWEEIITTNGAGTSNQILEYFETDTDPLEGLSYYRLKQTDFDGRFEYFNIESVRFESNNITGYMSLFPSPIEAGRNINIEFNNIPETELLVVLRDIIGNEFYSKMIVNIENGMLVEIPIDVNISTGVYFITASSENQFYSQKVIIK